MTTKLNRRTEGFTIIEVMIVLVIAAVILLIVFLAVPALQRNSRNTQRKNDVAAILAGMSEFTNNNNGTVPPNGGAWTNTGGTLTIVGTNLTSSQAKVGYYNAGIGAAVGDVNHANSGTLVAANTFNNAAHDYVQVASGTDCSGTAVVTGSNRSITAVYEVENGSGTYAQVCQSS